MRTLPTLSTSSAFSPLSAFSLWMRHRNRHEHAVSADGAHVECAGAICPGFDRGGQLRGAAWKRLHGFRQIASADVRARDADTEAEKRRSRIRRRERDADGPR